VSEDKIQVLNTIVHHRTMVQVALQTVTQALSRRSLAHDVSKFRADEFEGFSRINRTAREHPYGSVEYRAALKQEKPTIALHYARNSHHPEYWDAPDHNVGTTMMGLLDLIEMVCDWWAAWKVYDGQWAPEDRSSWMENVEKQRQRFLEPGVLSAEQWFVVDQMAHVLAHAHEWGGSGE
jgi:hypothetical protein